MKIGILTFHWATNYGAILQAKSLQIYLLNLGHDVEIINYKPEGTDYNFIYLIKHPRFFFKLKSFVLKCIKEHKLSLYRKSNLRITEKRYYNSNELKGVDDDYDVIISGSDQVLRPDFTVGGDGKGKPTSAYFLDFVSGDTKRIGYAVSYGCVDYPIEERSFAKKWINNFDFLGVREQSGIEISRLLGYKNMIQLVPDPTVLIGRELFIKTSNIKVNKKEDNVCVYTLRNPVVVHYNNVVYMDDTHWPASMERWIENIANASFFVTNSFHGMVVSLYFHTPFAILLECGKGAGMNDRFYTLLNYLGISDRIIPNNDNIVIDNIRANPIEWGTIDKRMAELRRMGEEFISLSLSY